eukprot:3159463-Rhodomonas_salina.1
MSLVLTLCHVAVSPALPSLSPAASTGRRSARLPRPQPPRSSTHTTRSGTPTWSRSRAPRRSERFFDKPNFYAQSSRPNQTKSVSAVCRVWRAEDEETEAWDVS